MGAQQTEQPQKMKPDDLDVVRRCLERHGLEAGADAIDRAELARAAFTRIRERLPALVLERDAEHARYMEAHTAAETLRSDLRSLRAKLAEAEAEEERLRSALTNANDLLAKADARVPELLEQERLAVARINLQAGRLVAAAEGKAASPTLPFVLAFARLMEGKLEQHRALKGNRDGWISDDPRALLMRLREEVNELAEAVYMGRVDAVPGEAADVGNFAMMVADVFGSLGFPRDLKVPANG